MLHADELKLVKEATSRGVFDTTTETTRSVFCEVRSIGMNEAYTAMSLGIHPELVFVLSDYAEYDGEKLVEYRNTRYRVVRTYVSKEKIELVCERVIG